MPYRSRGHGPKTGRRTANSTLLIDATLEGRMPAAGLARQQFMEGAKGIWEELGLPPLAPQAPWHGYTLGDWGDDWETFARRAVKGEWEANGRDAFARRRSGVVPENPVREVEGKKDVSSRRRQLLRPPRPLALLRPRPSRSRLPWVLARGAAEARRTIGREPESSTSGSERPLASVFAPR